MLLAGLSEFFIIASIIYALKTLKAPHPLMGTVFRLGLLVTLCASTLGSLYFLDILNVGEYHKLFTFISKHVALTAFIIGAGWGFYNSKTKKIIGITLLISALTSLALNTTQELSLLSMAIMLIAILFTLFCMRSSINELKLLATGTIILLSTLFWGAIISNQDLMIAVYHTCVAGFYFLTTLSFKKNDGA
jgi:hypothetical protein